MRVDAIVNVKAGFANAANIEQKLKAALFRCDLHLHSPKTLDETAQVIDLAIANRCEALVVCGGDGTLNTVLKPMMERHARGQSLPALCIIPVGTANDLAREMKISRKIDKAAHAILSGGRKLVDILEVIGDRKSAYMVTNGGLGVPAQTALQANVLRQWVKRQASSENLSAPLRQVFKLGKRAIELAGAKIYDLVLLNEVTHWDSETWKVRIEVPGKADFTTQAPFIMVNNQPSLGGKFRAAPFTSNTDGTFNVLLIEPQKILQQTKVILDIRRGKIPKVGDSQGFEATQVRFRSLETSRPFTFFGDGEILHRDVQEIEVRCIHPGLSLVTMESGQVIVGEEK